MVIGKAYLTKPTMAVTNNGMRHGERGHVTFVDGFAISLQMESGTYKVPRPAFGMNFTEADRFDTSGNKAYQFSKHFENEFKA